MLKVSEDGKTLRTAGGVCVASWQGPGPVFYIEGIAAGVWHPEEAQQLADFIKAGPPKRKWRITRVFDRIPTAVVHSAVDHEPPWDTVIMLNANDIEEVR